MPLGYLQLPFLMENTRKFNLHSSVNKLSYQFSYFSMQPLFQETKKFVGVRKFPLEHLVLFVGNSYSLLLTRDHACMSSHLWSFFFSQYQNEVLEVFFFSFLTFSIIHITSNNFQSVTSLYLYLCESCIFLSDLVIACLTYLNLYP